MESRLFLDSPTSHSLITKLSSGMQLFEAMNYPRLKEPQGKPFDYLAMDPRSDVTMTALVYAKRVSLTTRRSGCSAILYLLSHFMVPPGRSARRFHLTFQRRFPCVLRGDYHLSSILTLNVLFLHNVLQVLRCFVGELIGQLDKQSVAVSKTWRCLFLTSRDTAAQMSAMIPKGIAASQT